MSIVEISQLVEKAAKIVYYGLLNPPKLSSNQEYQTLYEEYIRNSELQEYLQSIASGLELKIFAIERDAVHISPNYRSPFHPNIEDIPVLGKEKNRGLFALIQVAIAAWFFSSQTAFSERGMKGFGIIPEDIHDFIEENIENLIKKKGEAIIKFDPENTSLQNLLSEFHSLNRISQTNPQSTTLYYIKKTAEYMKSQRLLTMNGDRYIPTTRFKIQMEEFCSNSYYLEFLDLFQNQDKNNI